MRCEMMRRRSRNAQGGQAHTRTEGLVQLLICYTRPKNNDQNATSSNARIEILDTTVSPQKKPHFIPKEYLIPSPTEALRLCGSSSTTRQGTSS